MIALASDPQWWWTGVFLPAAAGMGWLANFWFTNRQVVRNEALAERAQERTDRDDDWSHILDMNTRLVSANQSLEAKLAQFDPTLARIQQEYRETLTREMAGMEALRDLRIAHSTLQQQYADAERVLMEVPGLRNEIQALRAFLEKRGLLDQLPQHANFSEWPADAPPRDTPKGDPAFGV